MNIKSTVNIKRSSKKVILNKEDINRFLQVIEELEKDDNSYDFQEPVDHLGLGLSDYLMVIQKPMDLSTVKKNLKKSKYSTASEVLADIQLIWDNCKSYNVEGSNIYQIAQYMENLSKKAFDLILHGKKNLEIANYL